MLRKESKGVPEGNGPIPQQEEFGSGQHMMEDVHRMMKEVFDEWDTKMDKLLREYKEEWRSIDQRLTRLEHDARQPRLAMEADGPANTKTCERTAGVTTAVQAMHGDSLSACRGYPGPMSNSNSFGMMAELPTFPCRDDFVVEIGDAAPKSCLPSMAMRTITAAGGLLPTGKTATETTTFNESPLWLYATEETNSKEAIFEKTSTAYVSFDSSFWNLLAASSCRRVIETKSGQNRTFDPGGYQGHLRPCPFFGIVARVVLRRGCAYKSSW